jgi:hypothetical protein
MGKMYTHEEFIEIANQRHKWRYLYPERYQGSAQKIAISCRLHGEFNMLPTAHLVGQGCPICAAEIRAVANREAALNQRLSQDEFITRAKCIHGDKYDYSLTKFTGIKKFVTIICPRHGQFTQMAQAHIHNEQGCKKCFAEQRLAGEFSSFVDKAKAVHGQQYDYSEADLFDRDKQGRIKIICMKHGPFWQRPSDHTGAHAAGCPRCGRESVSESNSRRTMTHEQFVEKARAVHGNKYQYPNPYVPAKDGLTSIVCPQHGAFLQSSRNHINGNGCQACASLANSKMEQNWLTHIGVNLRNQRFIIGERKFIVDGFDPPTNTIYEFLGDYWHGNPNVYEAQAVNGKNGKTFGQLYAETFERIDFLKRHGFNVIYIWESEWVRYENHL